MQDSRARTGGALAVSALGEVERALLERVTPAPTADPPSGEEQTAIDIARSWTSLIVQPAFQPPRDARYVPMRAEGSGFDIVRVWYATALGELHIAQTFSVLALTLPAAAVRDVNATARQLLQQRDRIRLVTSGTEGEAEHGEQAPPDHDGYRDWVGHLRWWRTPSALAFVTLKTAEAPGRAVIGWGPGLNQVWFRLYAPRPE